MILLVPARLAALAFAFWKRSLFCGLAVVNAIMLTKTTWSFYYGGGSGWALLPPALVGPLVGLSICDAVILHLAHRLRGKVRYMPVAVISAGCFQGYSLARRRQGR